MGESFDGSDVPPSEAGEESTPIRFPLLSLAFDCEIECCERKEAVKEPPWTSLGFFFGGPSWMGVVSALFRFLSFST